MLSTVSDQDVARRLGISTGDVRILVDRGIFRPMSRTSQGYLFAGEEIARLSRAKGPSLAEAAAQVGVQIEQEMITSVAGLQKLRRRAAIAGVSAGVVGVVAIAVLATLFLVAPRWTSDFFGLYYRLNAPVQDEVASSRGAASGVLAASTTAAAVGDTSLLADSLKPLASVSLLVVKAADSQKYDQIVTGPSPANGTPGPAGAAGPPGAAGRDGADGAPGVAGVPGTPGSPGAAGEPGAAGADGVPGAAGATGPQGAPGATGATGPAGAAGPAGTPGAPGANGTNGLNGTNGVNGINGTNGTNGVDGVDGTSVADVTTTIGDIIIRDGSNTAARLGIGSSGQVLTVTAGLPAWQDPIGIVAESDTLDSVALRGASTSTLLTLSGGLTLAAGPLSLPSSSVAIAALAAGDYSAKLTSGSYAINILGNAATATTAVQFSGALAGDVTGTQAATVVSRINGATLGSTTPTAGNVLIGNGSAWVSQPVTAITGLGVANFSSAAISQWTNDAGYLTASSSNTLTNKTISGASNSLSNIGNASLVNSSVTISTAGPLSGGGSTSLGGAGLTLGCPTCLTSGSAVFSAAASAGSNSSIVQGGTLTLAAGLNMNTTGDGSGTITFATSATPSFTTVNGLTIASNGTNTLSIATGKTLTVSNSLTLSGTDGTAFVLPVTSDDLVGRTVTQTLTNKTLTAPVINGVVTTTGLTLPGFTAAGAIIGATTLTLDAGSSSTISLGTTNATALTIGRSGVTTTVHGTTAVDSLQIGGGTPILKHLSATTTFNMGLIAIGCSDMATVAVTGASPGDTALATPTPTAGGVETLGVSWMAYVSATDTVTIRGCGIVGLPNPSNQTWRVDVWQH